MLLITSTTLTLVLLLTASYLLFRALKGAGNMRIWALLTLAFSLMLVQTIIHFYDALVPDETLQLWTVWLQSGIALCVVLGLWPMYSIVTERRQTRRAYEQMLTSMSDVYYVTDADGLFEYISPSVFDFGGYRPKDLIGTPLADLYAPDLNNENTRANFVKALADNGGVVKGYKAFLLHHDGRRFQVETNAKIRTDALGKPTGVEGIVRDVTKREQSERLNSQLGRALENAAAEAYVCDADTFRFTIVNRGARENLGYSMEELRNLSPLDLQIEISAAEMEANLVPLQDGSKSVISFETVHRRKDGSFYPVEVTVQYGASELQPVYFGQAIDLTQRRKAEADLVQAQRLQSVGQLTGGVAHDFNNMLQALQLNLELIPPAQEVDTDYRSAALHIIDRAAQLTQRLLAFSRKQNLSPKQTDVNKTLSRLAGLLRRTLGETIELELQLADNINVVLVDEVQLESSLLNLVLNARDAMPAGGRLVLSTFAGHFPAASNGIDNLPEGDYVRLSVTDVGEGMTPEVLKNAIEPFFTTKDVGQGTGLGLSMVYGFVKQSGGFFILESKPGEGTVVHLLFPALVVSLPEQDAVSSGNKPSLHGSETILLIEDEQVVRDITRKALSDLGYQVISAADGQQALDLVQGYDGPIHLILSDVILPGGLSGPITVARLNETQGPMATVFMSGYVDMPDPVGRDMLADHGFLQKPFRREQLAAAIRLALD